MEVVLWIIAVLLFLIWLRIGKAVELLLKVNKIQITASDMNHEGLSNVTERLESINSDLWHLKPDSLQHSMFFRDPPPVSKQEQP